MGLIGEMPYYGARGQWTGGDRPYMAREYYSHMRILLTRLSDVAGGHEIPGASKPLQESRGPTLASLISQAFRESRAISLALKTAQGIPAPPGIEGPFMGPFRSSNPLNLAGGGCGHVAGPKKPPGAGGGPGDRGLERVIYKWCRPYMALKNKIT